MSNSNDFFQLSTDAGIAHLQLNRPERMNTMAPAFFPALRDAVQGLSDSGAVRVLVVSSTGKHFSAGMALDVFGAGSPLMDTHSARTRLRFQEPLRRLMACFDVLDEARFPVICAIQGGCIGGALDLAAACDIRVCSADAFFTGAHLHVPPGQFQMEKVAPGRRLRQPPHTARRLTPRRSGRYAGRHALPTSARHPPRL
jgi:enoyl-CoA hydratase